MPHHHKQDRMLPLNRHAYDLGVGLRAGLFWQQNLSGREMGHHEQQAVVRPKLHIKCVAAFALYVSNACQDWDHSARVAPVVHFDGCALQIPSWRMGR